MDELDLYVQSVLKDNSRTDVFKEFNSYLRTNCETEKSLINFVYLFIRYVGLDFHIPLDYDAYDLVGYIYSKVNHENHWDECGDLFDYFANEALRIDLVKNPYYQFWHYPKILEIAKMYRKNNSSLYLI